MQTKIALSIGMLAAAIGMVDAAPHNQFKRTNYSACKKYVYSYDGGHNVYSVNENKLVDASDANVNLSLLSPEGHKQLTWNNVPRHCLTYIKQVNGGHNVVEDNENKGVDLSGLNLGLNILKRNAPSYSYYDGGHNVVATNENKLIDVSDLLPTSTSSSATPPSTPTSTEATTSRRPTRTSSSTPRTSLRSSTCSASARLPSSSTTTADTMSRRPTRTSWLTFRISLLSSTSSARGTQGVRYPTPRS